MCEPGFYVNPTGKREPLTVSLVRARIWFDFVRHRPIRMTTDSVESHEVDRLSETDVERITRETYDRIAVPYCSRTNTGRMRPRILVAEDAFERLLRRRSKILILGAGDGRDAELFIDRGHRCVLLDYSLPMLALAGKRVPLGIRILADIRELPFSSESFDAVWASACLYHLRHCSLPTVLSQIHELLRLDGYFYCNLRTGTGEYLDPAPRSFPEGGPRFYAFYSCSQIAPLFAAFQLIRVLDQDEVLGRDYLQVWSQK